MKLTTWHVTWHQSCTAQYLDLILGILCGHIYFFLEEKYPNEKLNDMVIPITLCRLFVFVLLIPLVIFILVTSRQHVSRIVFNDGDRELEWNIAWKTKEVFRMEYNEIEQVDIVEGDNNGMARLVIKTKNQAMFYLSHEIRKCVALNERKIILQLLRLRLSNTEFMLSDVSDNV